MQTEEEHVGKQSTNRESFSVTYMLECVLGVSSLEGRLLGITWVG